MHACMREQKVRKASFFLFPLRRDQIKKDQARVRVRACLANPSTLSCKLVATLFDRSQHGNETKWRLISGLLVHFSLALTDLFLD
jgi:hypothetical protein